MGFDQIEADVEKTKEGDSCEEEEDFRWAVGLKNEFVEDSEDEDEDPEEDGRIGDVMHDFSAYQEAAGSEAQTEANHMEEDQQILDALQIRCSPFHQSKEDQRNDDDPLSFQHERPPSIFLEELPSEESNNDLHKGQINIRVQHFLSLPAYNLREDEASEGESGAAS